MSAIRKAVDDMGSEQITEWLPTHSWLLPNGEFLNLDEYDDHRVVSRYCEDSWVQFIEEGAVSLHYDGDGFLWLRVYGGMSRRQRATFESILEATGVSIDYLLIQDYRGVNVTETTIEDEFLCSLWLVDPVAYEDELLYAENGRFAN